MFQIGENPDDNGGEKPKFASLRPGQFIENITLADAMELFKMPRDLGLFEEKSVVVSIGRFGPYVLHDKKFVSIPKDIDPYTVPLEKSIELIQAKRIADANRLIKSFPEKSGDTDTQRTVWTIYKSRQKECEDSERSRACIVDTGRMCYTCCQRP
jgi:DNA topoisomerase-1